MFKRLLNNKLLRNIGVYTISNIVNASIPFLLLPVLTRYLTPEDYGITATFQALLGVIVPFAGMNTQTSIIRKYYNSADGNITSYVSNCILILLSSTLLILLLLGPFISNISTLTAFPRNWLWTILVMAFFQYLFAAVLSIYQIKNQVYRYAILQNAQTFLNLLISIILVVIIQLDWRGRILGQTIAISVFGFLAFYLIRRMKLIKLKFNKEDFWDALKFGAPLIPYTLTGWVLLSLDRIFINKMIGLSETGYYAVAYQICMVITLLQTSFNNAWVPWIFDKIKRNDTALNMKIVKFSYLFVLFNFCLAIMIPLLGPPLLSIFLGGKFQASNDFLFWLALSQACNSIHLIGVSYLSFHNKTVYLTYSAIITTLIHVPLTYMFIKANGAIGAAQSLFISNLITALLTFFFSTRVHKMPWLLKTSTVKIDTP